MLREEQYSTRDDRMAPPSVPTLEQFIALVKTRNLARSERFFVNFALPTDVGFSYNVRDLSLLCEEAGIPGKTIETRTLRINGLDEYRAHTASYGGEISLQFLIDTDWTARAIMEEWIHECITPVSKGREVGYYSDYAQDIGLFALIPAGVPGAKIAAYSPTQADSGLNDALSRFASEKKDESDRGTNVVANTVINRLMMRGRKTVDSVAAKAKSQTIGRLNLASNPLFELFRDTETIAYSVTLKECFPKSINVMPVSFSNPGVHRMTVTFAYKYWVSDANRAETLEEKYLRQFNTELSERLKKYTDRIPSNKLSGLGQDLKDKFSSLRGRFGG